MWIWLKPFPVALFVSWMEWFVFKISSICLLIEPSRVNSCPSMRTTYGILGLFNKSARTLSIIALFMLLPTSRLFSFFMICWRYFLNDYYNYAARKFDRSLRWRWKWLSLILMIETVESMFWICNWISERNVSRWALSIDICSDNNRWQRACTTRLSHHTLLSPPLSYSVRGPSLP